MKQYAHQVRFKLLALIMAGMTGAGLTTAASAAEAEAALQAGGTAGAHMNTTGSANSNAQWKSGATRGADRAADRMSPDGADMKQSGSAPLDADGKPGVKGKR